MEKKTYLCYLGCLFCLYLFVFFVLDFLRDDRSFSEFENRVLAQKPMFSIERLLEGRYTPKYEKYVNDQFYGRERWVKWKSSVDLLLGRRESNGVYYGKDGYLIEDFRLGPENARLQNLQAINEFINRHSDLNYSFLLVPNAISVLRENLPLNAPVLNQVTYMNEFASQLNEQITFINPFQMLREHQDEGLFYKTDHHWTTLGAYYTYRYWAEQIGIEEGEESYRIETITSAFNGTLTSTSGYTASTLDQIQIYLPMDEANQVIVNYVEEQKRVATLYDVQMLDKKDKYAVFLGGNHALVKIKTTSMKNEKLLVIKDSYANAFIPFLTSSYRDIIVVDPRYYFDDLDVLMEREGITDILFLYNVNTFFSDNSLNLVLTQEE